MAGRDPGPDRGGSEQALREVFLERCRAVLAKAARWCPEATSAQMRAALDRLAFEQADAHGLSESLGLERPPGWPSGGERDLMDACERILRTEVCDILDGFRPTRGSHPPGCGPGPAGETCGSCAWLSRGRCLQGGDSPLEAPKVGRTWPSCARWEAELSDDSCGSCGACCREGYSFAPVAKGEAMREAHPEWIRREGRSAFLPRPDGRCVALEGDGSMATPWRCRAYEVRPRACSELAPGSRACLVARRRTGLSR